MNNDHFCKDCKQNFQDSKAKDEHFEQCLLINGIDGCFRAVGLEKESDIKTNRCLENLVTIDRKKVREYIANSGDYYQDCACIGFGCKRIFNSYMGALQHMRACFFLSQDELIADTVKILDACKAKFQSLRDIDTDSMDHESVNYNST